MMICPFKSDILQNTVNILQDETYKVRPQNEVVPKLFQGLFIGEVFGALVRMNDGEQHRILKLAVSQALDYFDEQYIQQQAEQVIQASKIVIDSPEMLTQAIQTWPIMVIAEQIGLYTDDEFLQHVNNFVNCMSNPFLEEKIQKGNESAIWLYQHVQSANGPLKQQLVEQCAKQNITDSLITNSNLLGFFFQTLDGTSGLIGLTLLESQLLAIKNTRRFLANEMVVLSLQDDGESLAFGAGAHCCPGKLWAKVISQTVVQYLTQLPIQKEWLQNYEWKVSMNANVPLFISKGATE
ncbi:MAG: hypothetical protein ACRCXK_11465 [Wohlfahrtiimonas sp.]